MLTRSLQVALSRYDFFHAHLFAAHGSGQLVRLLPTSTSSIERFTSLLMALQHQDIPPCAVQQSCVLFFRQVVFAQLSTRSCYAFRQGLLFHAREYPALDNDTAAPSYFPYNLGYCQSGTPLAFEGNAMDHRNILYFQVYLL